MEHFRKEACLGVSSTLKVRPLQSGHSSKLKLFLFDCIVGLKKKVIYFLTDSYGVFWDKVLWIIQLDLSHLKSSIFSNYWDWQQDSMDIILCAHNRWELDPSRCSGHCALQEDVNRRNAEYIASPQQSRENGAVLERWGNQGSNPLRKELNKQVLSA